MVSPRQIALFSLALSSYVQEIVPHVTVVIAKNKIVFLILLFIKF
jgi:hypothetical protein